MYSVKKTPAVDKICVGVPAAEVNHTHMKLKLILSINKKKVSNF